MGYKNNLIPGIDTPGWEQLPPCPFGNLLSGSSITDDEHRYIYCMVVTSTTAATFCRYDTINKAWQELATPPTQAISVGKLIYTKQIGKQYKGVHYGSVYSLQFTSTTKYWYRYDIADNQWYTLDITVPPIFTTDASVVYLSPRNNNYESNYHTGVLKTISLTNDVPIGATTISVPATSTALPSGASLYFGSIESVISNVSNNTVLTLSTPFPNDIAAGAVLLINRHEQVIVANNYTNGDATISIKSGIRSLYPGDTLSCEIRVILSASASLGATSLSVYSTLISIPSSATALWYDHMYMVGFNSTAIYRYSISGNTWYTTSANSGNPAIQALPGSAGAGVNIRWSPNDNPNRLLVLRGGATSNIYSYDLVNNQMYTETYTPNTTTFTTATCVAMRSIGNKYGGMLIRKDTTMRFYEYNYGLGIFTPKAAQLITDGTAAQGDKIACLKTPDKIEQLYAFLNSSNILLSMILPDQ